MHWALLGAPQGRWGDGWSAWDVDYATNSKGDCEYVIEQETAKKSLAVAVYNHYKRIKYLEQNADEKNNDAVELQKSNVLMLGPTGSGKTLLAQTMARILNVPFAIVDATSLTEAGYVGEDVENILLRLYQAADGDLDRAQKGIIYIDEIERMRASLRIKLLIEM